MRMLVRFGVLATSAALLATGFAGAAWAGSTSDLRVTTAPVTGKIGQIVTVRVDAYNAGPDPTETTAVQNEFSAPEGTEFVLDFAGIPSCTTLVPKRKFRCRVNGMWYPDSSSMGGPYPHRIDLKIVGKVTAPGTYRLICACDPKSSNNSVALVVNGVRSRVKPSPKPSPKPLPKPSLSPSPSTAPSVEPSTSEYPVPTETGPAPTPYALEPAANDGDGSLRTLGIGAVLAGLVALGGGVYLWRRRVRTVQPGPE